MWYPECERCIGNCKTCGKYPSETHRRIPYQLVELTKVVKTYKSQSVKTPVISTEEFIAARETMAHMGYGVRGLRVVKL